MTEKSPPTKCNSDVHEHENTDSKLAGEKIKVRKSKRKIVPRKRSASQSSDETSSVAAATGQIPNSRKIANGNDSSSILDSLRVFRSHSKRPGGISSAELLNAASTTISPDGSTGRRSSPPPVQPEVGQTFTTRNLTLDTTKLMTDYIETEMGRLRQQDDNSADSKEQKETIQDQLFEFPQHLKVDTAPAQEGNVTVSSVMLTAIPEVDLGSETRVSNVLATEMAKKNLGKPWAKGATDDAAYERFRKRMRK